MKGVRNFVAKNNNYRGGIHGPSHKARRTQDKAQLKDQAEEELWWDRATWFIDIDPKMKTKL